MKWTGSTLIPSKSPTVASVVETLRQSTTSEVELAVAIHDYVRDSIHFGFTRKHDTADASYTLEQPRPVGHCTPKTTLFCELLREAGFKDATMVTVPISGDVLRFIGRGGSSPLPHRLQHSFTEVTVSGKKCRVDSYTVDTPLYNAVRPKLLKMHKDHNNDIVTGYGIHLEGTTHWNGDGDAFIQYVPSSHTPELEVHFDNHHQLVQSSDYLHSDLITILSIPILGWVMGQWLERCNVELDSLRNAQVG